MSVFTPQSIDSALTRDLDALFAPPTFPVESERIEYDTSSLGRSHGRPSRRPQVSLEAVQKPVRLGNSGRRMVRSAIAKALVAKPELRDKCRKVATVKSATVKQLLKICEIAGVRDVAEEALITMDPTIDVADPQLWESSTEEELDNKNTLPEREPSLTTPRNGFSDSWFVRSSSGEGLRNQRTKSMPTTRSLPAAMSSGNSTSAERTSSVTELSIFDNPVLHFKLQPLLVSSVESSSSSSTKATSPSTSSGWFSSPVARDVSEPEGFYGLQFGDDSAPTASSVSASLVLHNY